MAREVQVNGEGRVKAGRALLGRGAGGAVRAAGVGLALLGMVALLGAGQTRAGWTVERRWVGAHEEFLASDAMAGRGSATRDEAVAATYVASEFMGYGLKPAPGMTGYLQEAAVDAPELDGGARLSAGALALEEGKGLRLLLAAPGTVAGPMVAAEVGKDLKLSKDSSGGLERGAVVVAKGAAEPAKLGQLLRAARRAGAVAVIVTEGAGTKALTDQWGGVTRVPKRLAEAPRTATVDLVALSSEAMTRLLAESAGSVVTLAVRAVPQTVAKKTYNAMGYLPGSDPAAGTLLLTAHLDHLGVGRAVNGDAIYNGANDDAAGTTAVLELAHALAAGPKLRRSVLFVCYGSEEAGELGSEYFGRHSPVALKDIVANLEFEMIGVQDPKMPKGVLLLTGWERSNLGPALKAHGAKLGPDPYPEQHFFERSDNYQLALEGVVAHTAAGWGTPPTYHQPSDDLAHLDLGFMTAAIQSLVEPVRWLAESEFKPAWTKDGQPKRQER